MKLITIKTFIVHGLSLYDVIRFIARVLQLIKKLLKCMAVNTMQLLKMWKFYEFVYIINGVYKYG